MKTFPVSRNAGTGIITVTALLLLLSACLAGTPDWQRTSLPALVIPAPATAADRQYLGLAPAVSRFTLDQVKGRLVVLEFILAQCPHCQHEAPKMKHFYNLVKQQGLDKRIKFISVALGNTRLESNLFKERYEVPFPVIPNPGRRVMEIEATPTLYFIRPEAGGSKVLFEAVGRLPDGEELLRRALELGDFSPS